MTGRRDATLPVLALLAMAAATLVPEKCRNPFIVYQDDAASTLDPENCCDPAAATLAPERCCVNFAQKTAYEGGMKMSAYEKVCL